MCTYKNKQKPQCQAQIVVAATVVVVAVLLALKTFYETFLTNKKRKLNFICWFFMCVRKWRGGKGVGGGVAYLHLTCESVYLCV